MEQRGRDGVHPWSKFCCEFESQKTSRWFPSSAPSEGMQQEFIVTPTQPTTLHRCTQQKFPESRRPLCIFHNSCIAGRTHFRLASLSLLSDMQKKNVFFLFQHTNGLNVIIDSRMFGLWKTIPIHDCLTELCFFFLRKAHKQKRFPIYRCRRGREIEGNKLVQSLAWKLKKFIQWLLFTSLTNMMTLRGQPTTLISGS